MMKAVFSPCGKIGIMTIPIDLKVFLDEVGDTARFTWRLQG